MGAVYLDAGPEVAMGVGRRLFAPRIDEAAPGAADYKSRAQEASQARGMPSPSYQLMGARGPDHDRTFDVRVHIDGEPRGQGSGRSKLEAEQRAAKAALDWLRSLD